MAITKIDDVFLYVGITDGVTEANNIKKWLVANNINYTLLFYGDDAQHADVFVALNSWWPDTNIVDFPVLVYTEIHDDLPPSRYPRKYFQTLADIQGSNFLSTYTSTNSDPR
jgi:hypothetical protein